MEIQKRRLLQIKIFKIDEENAVNDYVISCFNETGNSPQIGHSGNYISVTCERLVETNYQIPKRIIPNIDTNDLYKRNF